MLKPVISLSLLMALAANANAAEIASYSNNQESHSEHTLNAPAGVMGDHVMKQGDFMLSYQLEYMKMKGYRDGTDKVSTGDILNNYDMAATDMSMEMHMLNAMYGAGDNFTAMIMVPYVKKEMTHIDSMGMSDDMSADGIGDIKLSGISNIYENHDSASHSMYGVNINYGVSLPTGSIDEDFTHDHGMGMTEEHHMDYMMQLGSGTFDPTIGITVYKKNDGYYIGSQASYTPRFGKNDNGYRLGNEARLNSWVSKDVTDFLSASFRVDAKNWGNIKGQDQMVSTMMLPGGVPDQTGGTRVDALVGLDLYKQVSGIGTHKLAVEYGMPVYENLDGPQMSTDQIINLNYTIKY